MLDVLNLEWMSYPARDRNMSSLVCNYLRYQGFSVIEESVFRGFKMLEKYKPKVLLLANGIGAPINFQLVKFAALKGIKVVTLVSEGNYLQSPEALEPFLWGWNTDKQLYEETSMHWSNRTRELALSCYPALKSKLKVSGGCGFDIYKIRPVPQKKDFLKKFGKDGYSKTVGIGCWDFGYCSSSTQLSLFNKDETLVKGFFHDRDLFNRVLLNIIKANPTVLFILKEHPGNTQGHYMSGIEGTESFDNVLILKKESIIDTIAASDFWIIYESTTVLEAWLLGKPTGLLNPTGLDFPRANVHFGSPNFPDEDSFQNAIDVFYETGELPFFNDGIMTAERKKVIMDTIQWDDGLNHVRAGNEIIRVLESNVSKEKSSIPLDLEFQRIKQFLVNTFHIKKSSIYQRNRAFNQKEVRDYSASLYQDQIRYYQSLGLSKEELLNILSI